MSGEADNFVLLVLFTDLLKRQNGNTEVLLKGNIPLSNLLGKKMQKIHLLKKLAQCFDLTLRIAKIENFFPLRR